MKTTSTQTHSSLPKPFDLASDDDAQELKTWCRLHWLHTLSKGILNSNAPTYHDCCISFSRKGYVKRLSHPPLQSASVLKIPSLRKTNSPEEFYDWLRERLVVHHRLGKKLFFPSINVAHFMPDEEEECVDQSHEQERYLSKRNERESEEEKRTEEEIRQLREDNKRLLTSSKSWHRRYQELLLKVEEDTASYTEMTPKKPLKLDSADDNFLSL